MTPRESAFKNFLSQLKDLGGTAPSDTAKEMISFCFSTGYMIGLTDAGKVLADAGYLKAGTKILQLVMKEMEEMDQAKKEETVH